MSHIINLRGTSGSGKSYIVRHIMAQYHTRVPEMVPGRKQPLAYTCSRVGWPSLYVVGHYETACGGADTIGYSANSRLLDYDGELRGGLDLIYHMIHNATLRKENVIFEGLIVASDTARCINLKKTNDLMVVGLSTTLKDCMASIQDRRDARGDDRPLSSKNTEAKFKALLTQRARFREAGVNFQVLDRAAALTTCMQFFGLETAHHSV